MSVQQVLIGGQWSDSRQSDAFQAENPATGERLEPKFPISSWQECDEALDLAVAAMRELRTLPVERLAVFLDAYAEGIESRAAEICQVAHRETALAIEPRLLKVELPRTTNQLRLAATAVRKGDWRMATIDTAANIRSYLAPLGPVCVFGPNNFPLAFNSISGGDFAAAIAAGNPVLAKANPSHPETTRLLAQEAQKASEKAELPRGTVQLLYGMAYEDGERLVADPRVGATAYTGSRSAGLKLKAAADKAGKPIYLELSSLNPVVLLPGAVAQRSEELVGELAASCLLGVGQFCTCPNLTVMIAGDHTERFVTALKEQLSSAPIGTLLSSGVLKGLKEAVAVLAKHGAEVLTGGDSVEADGFMFQNTLLRVSGEQFVADPAALQTEAFGNAATVIVAQDQAEAASVLSHIEGSLTGSFYTAADGSDEELYHTLEPILRPRVGRLLNDKMPTGVAVSPAMNHGGPYPATGHPGWTSVGIPAALRRFAMLQCFDNVRPERLPKALRDENPNGTMWRYIDGEWTQGNAG